VTDRFSVDPDSLRAGGAQIGAEAHALAGALTRLQGVLGSLGDVCGGDQPGRSFAAGYQPKVQLLEEALRRMVLGLEDVETGLRVMAANYEGSEAASRVVSGTS
jgi:uncharacterized protein YukE